MCRLRRSIGPNSSKFVMDKKIIATLRCTACHSSFREQSGEIVCSGCVQTFAVEGGKIFFISPPGDSPAPAVDDARDRDRWTDWRKSNYQFLYSELNRIDRSSVLLDLGVGNAPFRDLTDSFAVRIAADFSPHPNVNVVCNLLNPLPFQDNTFDVVIASNVLEHIPDARTVLLEARRVLRPGGRFVATIPFLMRMHQRPYDFHRYTDLMLMRMFQEAGFHQSSIKPLGTSFDVYQHIGQHFFSLMFDRSDDMNHAARRFAWWWAVRLSWWAHRVLMAVCWPVFRRAPVTPDFTEGYGCVAVKEL